jgi:peptidoglycan/xylan/chitin deacetylase (PgdA/CDA1 family)/spore germination protein YaaH/GT2 family glycosyltransferase
MHRKALLVVLCLVSLTVLVFASPLASVLFAVALVTLRYTLRRRRPGTLRRAGLMLVVGTTLAASVAALAVPVYRNRPSPLLVPVDNGSVASSGGVSAQAAGSKSGSFEALGFVVSDDDKAAQAVDGNVGRLSTLAATGLSLGRNAGSLDVLTGSDAAQRAHLNGARGLIVLSNYAQNGFDGARVKAVLKSATARRRILSAVSVAVARGSYDGVVLDFERLDGSLRQPLLSFVGQLRRTLGAARLVVAVPASEDPFDPDLQAFDLAGLAAVADRILLMAYDQHEGSSGPGPVAGLDWVQRVLAVDSSIPPPQLLLGVPSYGYSWPKGSSPVDITVAQGRQLAATAGARVSFDKTAQEVHVVQADGGQAWYDDARSVRAHVMLARRLKLAGVGIWRLGGGDPIDAAQLGGLVERQAPRAVAGREVQRVKAAGLVALTFDDGPDPTWTPAVLAVLRKYDVPATFFVVGTQAQSHPDLVRQEIRDGDVVGNHTYSHLDVSKQSAWRARAEVEGGALVIEGITGRRPLLFRSPFGAGELSDKSSSNKDAQAEQLGFHAVNWTADTLDWKRPGISSIVEAVDSQASDRTVVLMHDGGGDRSQTLAALPTIIQDLRARGYQFTTVDAFDGTIASPYAHRSGFSSHLRGLAIVAGFRLDMALRKVALALLLLLAGVAGLRLLISAPLALAHHRAERKATARSNPTSPGTSPAALPTISVLVPAHNEAAVIDRTIESLLALTPAPLEIIVIDDGSTDGTAAIASRYPVRVLRQTQAGKAHALNRGLTEASGDVILTMDADTIVATDLLRHMLSHFNEPTVVAVAGNVKVGNRKGLLPRLQALEYIVSLNLDRRAQAFMGTITVVPGAAGAFRRSALNAIGGYPTDTLVEDADLTMALLRAGGKIRYESKAIAYTEAPQTFTDVLRQRRRWAYGTVQVAAKHRTALTDGRSGRAGIVALPWLVLSQVLIPALGPLVDLYLLYLWLIGNGQQALIMLALAIVLDIVVAGVALALDREDPRLLAWVPLMRFVWRPLQLWTATASAARWLNGTTHSWGRLKRYGTVKINTTTAATAT